MNAGTGIFITAGATILAAVIGLYGGKSIEQKNIQQQIYNALGDNSSITINDVSDILTDYENLKAENESFKEQNKYYYDQLQSKTEELSNVAEQMKKVPDIQYENLSLCIDGEDIPVNNQQSMIILDGREYLSKDFANKLISEDKSITVKDGTLYIGRVVADKEKLSAQNILDKGFYIQTNFNAKDSYGNVRTEGIYSTYYDGSIIYSINKNFSYLKCNISMSEEYSIDRKTVLTIKADENVVYSIELNKTTEPYDIEIPINSCKLLTFNFDSNSSYKNCIISDAILYN